MSGEVSSMEQRRQNQALTWLCLCYPGMPPAFACAFWVCTGTPQFLPGLLIYYALLSFSLVLCWRELKPARWAFGCAALVFIVHLYLAVCFVGKHLHALDASVPEFLDDLLMPTMNGVAFFVGLGVARLAFLQGRKGLALALLVTSALQIVDARTRLSPPDDPRFFLSVFALQALLVWRARWRNEDSSGMGFSPQRE